jgi:hypothetical protein
MDESQNGEADMPAKYIVVPHKIPSKPDAPLTYYPRLESTGEITLREIINELAAETIISQVDTIAVIENLLQNIPRYLAKGNLGWMCKFSAFFPPPVTASSS